MQPILVSGLLLSIKRSLDRRKIELSFCCSHLRLSIGRFFYFYPMEVSQMKLKELKKVLMTGKGTIIVGAHTKIRLSQRGYTKGDIVSAIFTGEIVERQGVNKVAIAGKDKDDNPIVIVVAKQSDYSYKLVTVMPPTDHFRFKDCI